MKSNMRFLSSVMVLCVFGIAGANAAPSVRMLGTNTARVGTNAAVVKSDSKATTSTPQRLGSIRAKNIGTAAPVTINKVSSATLSSGSSDESRLGLGKYVHANVLPSGSVKPAKAPAENPAQTSDLTALTDRVSDLEIGIEGKQDAVSVGAGLVLDSNTISLNEEMAGLPGQFDTLSEDVAALADEMDGKLTSGDLNNYYTKQEVDSKVTNIVVGDMDEALSGKQDAITDLASIRSGAAAGATAVQPAALSNYATKEELQNVAAPDLSGYLTEVNAQQIYQPIGTYISNPNLPAESGDFMLVVNRDENGAYVYSWQSVPTGGGSGGGTSGGSGGDWEFDDSNW